MKKVYLVEQLTERAPRGPRPVGFRWTFERVDEARDHFAYGITQSPDKEWLLDAKEGSARLNIAVYHGERAL